MGLANRVMGTFSCAALSMPPLYQHRGSPTATVVRVCGKDHEIHLLIAIILPEPCSLGSLQLLVEFHHAFRARV